MKSIGPIRYGDQDNPSLNCFIFLHTAFRTVQALSGCMELSCEQPFSSLATSSELWGLTGPIQNKHLVVFKPVQPQVVFFLDKHIFSDVVVLVQIETNSHPGFLAFILHSTFIKLPGPPADRHDASTTLGLIAFIS